MQFKAHNYQTFNEQLIIICKYCKYFCEFNVYLAIFLGELIKFYFVKL